MEDYNIKLILQGIGQHLVISVTLGQLAAAFGLVDVLANNKIAFTLAIIFAGTYLRINGFFALHIAAEARVNYCSKHQITPFVNSKLNRQYLPYRQHPAGGILFVFKAAAFR
nr:hypothetical protein [Phascolarctobacterium succinatutens]